MSTTAEYLQELARTAGLDDESKAALTKVLANQKFIDEVGKGIARQSDYSRNMDEVTKLRTETEAKLTEWKTWYASAVERDAERETEFQRIKGNPNPNPNPN